MTEAPEHYKPEKTSPVFNRRDHLQFWPWLEITIEKQCVQNNQNRADHQEVGECAEWCQVLEIADHAEENHWQQSDCHQALYGQRGFGEVVQQDLLHVGWDPHEVHTAEAELADD